MSAAGWREERPELGEFLKAIAGVCRRHRMVLFVEGDGNLGIDNISMVGIRVILDADDYREIVDAVDFVGPDE